MLTLGERYILIAFAIDNLMGKGNLVDAYHGDINLLNKIPNYTLSEITKELLKLKDDVNNSIIDEFPGFRNTYLNKQIDALLIQLSILEGKNKKSYRDIAKIMTDVRLDDPDEQKIEELRKCITELLLQKGYKGTFNEMLNKLNADSVLDFDKYLGQVNVIKSEFSKKSYDLMQKYILTEEDVKYIRKEDKLNFFVEDSDKGWSAYNYYDRDYSGKVVFNRKRGNFFRYNIEHFVAHEAYPGHHTSDLIRELLYNKKFIGEEASIHLLNTPECTIAEGIGDYGINFIGYNKEDVNYNLQIALSDLNAEVRYLTAIKLYENKCHFNDIIEIYKEYLCLDQNAAEVSLEFLKKWPYYVPNYKFGREIIGNSFNKYGFKILKHIYGTACNSTIKKWGDYAEQNK